MNRPHEADAAPSPEYRMLLACARSRMDDVHAALIRSLGAGDLNWDVLAAIARRHSLFPLLYRQLAAVVPDRVPAGVMERLKEQYQGNAARNVFLAAELERVLQALADDGIGALPYKGPLLALQGYGDLSLRRFVDLDVMVRKADVERAIGMLTTLGYHGDPGVTPAGQAFLIRTQHDLAFKRDEGRLIVELHWEVVQRRFAAELDAERLWRDATMRPLGGRDVVCLAPEDVLLSLCVHGAKHLWERLAWICDVAEWLASHPSLRWTELLARAERAGQERMLLTGLQLAAELLDAPLPPSVVARIEHDRAITSLTSRAKQILFRDPPRPPGMISSMRFHLLARPAWRERWSYLRYLLTPTDADVRAVRVPRALHFIYYLVRPFRLLAKKEHLH